MPTTPAVTAALAVAGLVVVSLAHIYLFMAQRTARLLCTSGRIPGELMWRLLPSWYLQLVWPVIALRWGFLLAVVVWSSWWAALLLAAVSCLVTTFAPIPHRLFLRFMERRAAAGMITGDQQSDAEFQAVLQQAISSGLPAD